MSEQRPSTGIKRGVFRAVGLCMVAIGALGVALPVLPTTPFLIIAAACFARSSPRLEAWLLDHPQFGPFLREWRARGAIPRRGKILSLVGMTFGFFLFWHFSHPGLLLSLAVLGLMGIGAGYVLSRPS
ncbi:YbaN family protein [Methyloligella sp. 2.7D]